MKKTKTISNTKSSSHLSYAELTHFPPSCHPSFNQCILGLTRNLSLLKTIINGPAINSIIIITQSSFVNNTIPPSNSHNYFLLLEF